MNIIFADRKLEKYANDYKLSIRKLGAVRAELYQRRLQDMLDVESFADLKFLPGNFHQLTGDRVGQWACNLDQPYRLIFQPGEAPVPKDEKWNTDFK